MRNIKSVIVSTTAVTTESHKALTAKAQKQDLRVLRYRAVWRSQHLIVLPLDCHPFRKSVTAVMEGDRERLLACLQKSTVKRVLLSPQLPMAELRCWANVAHGAGLSVYVMQRVLLRSLRQRGFLGRLKHVLGRIAALGLLLLLAPVLSVISFGLLLANGQIFDREWRVGVGGKIFRELSFAFDSTQLPLWLKLESIAALPRIVNVFWGDIELRIHGSSLSGIEVFDSQV